MDASTPCRDAKLKNLCLKYSDIAPCCNAVGQRGGQLRERGKILWGRAGCVDLFEIKKELLKRNFFEFKATSWCMFPVLKKGDALKVEHVCADDMKIGDIPAYRSGDMLYAHRIVDKRIIDGKRYIITRPDESGDEYSMIGEKVPEENILGRITEVKRGKKVYTTQRRRANSWDRFLYRRDRLFTKITKSISKVLNSGLTKIQSFKFYRWMARKIVKKLQYAVSFQLATPSKTKLEIYEYQPLEKIDDSLLKGHKSFHIRMKLGNTPIGCASFLNRAEGCQQKGLWLCDFYIRHRYRNIGFEQLLSDRTKGFLRESKIENKVPSYR